MLYLCEEFLVWFRDSGGGTLLDEAPLRRAHALWEHAETLITPDSTELQLSDGISNLKRALNQRLKAIEANYHLRQAPITQSPTGYLALLQRFGVIRPLMLKQLMDLRNDIEHNDAKPPPYERCQELLDVIWYFLRSTDGLLKIVPDSLLFSHSRFDDETYWITANLEPEENWSISLLGWVPAGFLLDSPSEGFAGISEGGRHTRDERWPNSQDHIDRKSSDWWFSGTLLPSERIHESIIRSCMTL